MTLIETIKADYLASRYAKDTLKANLLSTLLGEAQAIGKDAGNRDATDAETITVIKKFYKNGEATGIAIMTAQRPGYIDEFGAVKKELDILESYLPEQMDAKQIRFLVNTYLDSLENANMGLIMGYFKANYAGKYDGKLLSEIAKEQLA